MTLLLNFVYPVVIGLLIWAFFRKRQFRYLVMIPIFFVVYSKVQPSYIPKGDITRTSVPEFQRSKAEIEDRNRKPVPSEIRNAEQREAYRQGLPFIER